jgi:uncharacterized membrane protein
MSPTKPEPSKPKPLPDAFALFKPSWKAFRLNLETFLLQFLFPFGLVILTVLLFNWMEHNDSALAATLTIAAGLLTVFSFILMTAMLILTELRSAKGQHVSFEQVAKESLPYIPRLIGLLIICGVLITVGFILLIVPGLFAIQRLLLAPYFLVDQKMGIIAAIKASFKTAKKHSAAIWGITGILIAINIIGIIPLWGWIASALLTVAYLCAPAIRYYQVKG